MAYGSFSNTNKRFADKRKKGKKGKGVTNEK
jgi:hypothetical protein